MKARARTLSALVLGATPTLLILAIACQSSAGARPGAASVSAGTTGRTLVTRVSKVRLERHPCFGTCPVYVLEVDSSGRVGFEGRAHVRVLGAASAVLEREAFTDVAEELIASGFPSFRASYVAGAAGCGDYATDLPTVVLAAVIDGALKQVVHDYGCSGAPRELRRLHRMIDSVAGTSRWLLESTTSPSNP